MYNEFLCGNSSIAFEKPVGDSAKVNATIVFDTYAGKNNKIYLYCHHNSFKANKK